MILHDNACGAIIEQLRETRKTLETLRSYLEFSDHDRFASPYTSRGGILVCQRGGKQIERCVISSVRIAESMGL
jgi:hypothetical protein